MTASFTPLFFSGRKGPIYGVHHAPAAGADRAHGVLFLPPLGQEYKRCHKTLQKLAGDLARHGFHVLRFDYGGSGDSPSAEDWCLQSWRDDAEDAMAQLERLSGARSLSAFGVRLGAGVATQLAAPLTNLVLWDPIGDGPAYLGELEQLNLALLHRFRHSSRRRGRIEVPSGQLVGHRFPDRMRDSLRDYSLAVATPARRALWIETEATPATANYKHHAGQLAATARHARLEARCHWRSLEEIGNVIMGQPVARQVLGFLQEDGEVHGNGA